MIRTSKHNISKTSNKDKLSLLENLYNDFKEDVQTYIYYIIDGVLPLKIQLSSKLLPNEKLKHSKLKRIAYAEASKIIRSQIKKSTEKRYKNYKKIYSYFKTNNKQNKFLNKKYSELNIKDILKSKYFTIPNIKNVQLLLTNELYNIQRGNTFDNFISLPTNVFNEKGTRNIKVNIPLKYHKHSNKLFNNDYKRCNSIGIEIIRGKIYINIFWEKEDVKKKDIGNSIGIDIGYNKLIVSSDKQILGNNLNDLYIKIAKKKKHSKKYYKLLEQRNNLINYACNSLNINDVKTIILEDLKNVKKDKSFKTLVKKGKNKLNKEQQTDYNNKSQYWSYRQVMNKINRICEENGILLVKVSPAYTSQTCSSCGYIHEDNRDRDIFHCLECNYEDDADINASINIHNRGIYSSFNQENELSGIYFH